MENKFKPIPIVPENRVQDFKPRKLSPPQFEIDLRTSHNPHIALSQTIKCVIMRGVKL